LGLGGCGKGSSDQALQPAAKPAEPPPDHVVAMVNGTPLVWADMDKRAMGYLKDDVETNHLVIPPTRMDEAKEYFRRRSINAFVFKTLMLDEAAKQRIKLSEADRQEGLRGLAGSLKSRNWTTNDFFLRGPLGEATMRREFEDGMVIDKLLKLNARAGLKVEEKELVAAITEIGATNDLKQAKLEGIRKQLLAGADFESVARTVSECPSAKNGGDLGEFARGKMDPAFEVAAFAQAVGALGPVVQTRFGYHLIKVTAHTPPKNATASTPAVPETVRASHILIKRVPVDRKQLSDALMRAKFNAAVQKYFAGLKAKAKIECYLYKDMTF
jgi:peptidyl-prolyl cis-trans isomerase C